MKDYIDKRKKQKLYQQWVEKSGLPPESVPGHIEQQEEISEPVEEGGGGLRLPVIRSEFNFRLTLRHLLYLLLIIVVLLISTVSLATVLIMRSC